MTAADDASCELTLFVSGASELSARAIADTRRLCESILVKPCRLAIVDVNEDPAAALTSDVVAAPTLVKHRPLPTRRIVGDLSDIEKVLAALDLAEPAPSAPDRPPHAAATL